eukprot:TRINITY_DN28630_c0_g1_i1.p1 TRINITY_DN28630_c0_g1~~TRINITY_DN28630_c0_g1_i1.p1  ORF type:complete len:208 (-),score=25.26 TRINITY_DN28630_c0_g1_i1:87-626(-)
MMTALGLVMMCTVIAKRLEERRVWFYQCQQKAKSYRQRADMEKAGITDLSKARRDDFVLNKLVDKLGLQDADCVESFWNWKGSKEEQTYCFRHSGDNDCRCVLFHNSVLVHAAKEWPMVTCAIDLAKEADLVARNEDANEAQLNVEDIDSRVHDWNEMLEMLKKDGDTGLPNSIKCYNN